MRRIIALLRLLLRLKVESWRHGRQTKSLYQVSLVTRLTSSKWRMLLGSWLASLGLFYLTSGQLHVRIPDHLPVQLLLGPEQHPHTDRQLALSGLGVLSLQYCCIQLTSNLIIILRYIIIS